MSVQCDCGSPLEDVHPWSPRMCPPRPVPLQGRLTPAAPDTTGGELRWQLEQMAAHKIAYVNDTQLWGRSRVVDAILALPALRDLLAERDKLAAQVEAVEALAEELDAESEMYGENADGLEDVNRASAIGRAIVLNGAATRLRRALGTPTTGGGE